MRRVICLSPFAAESPAGVESNILYARRVMMDSLRRYEAPFLSHLIYTQVLHDDNPAQRSLGFQCEEAWLSAADLIAVYTDLGISPGMKLSMDKAFVRGLTIDFRWLDLKQEPQT